MAAVERYVPFEEALKDVPAVPEGLGRVLEARGYTELPSAGGRVVALGRSRPFDVPNDSSLEGKRLPIVLRRVGVYTRPADSSGRCLDLSQSRAGHTATLLPDGRVLLAGGYQLDSNGAPSTLNSTELFDPLGQLDAGPKMGAPRAFHTATPLTDGQVLLAGGEVLASGRTVSASAEVFDAARGVLSTVALKAARSRHAAAADNQGRVLLVGGMDSTGAVVARAEGYDSSTGQTFSVATPVPRVGLSAMALGDGQRIAVVGGTDGTELRPEVLFFVYGMGSFIPSGVGRLSEPRRDGALVPFAGAQRLLYVGGLASSGDTKDDKHFLGSSQVLSPDDPEHEEEGPVVFPRSRLCAVALPDGRVMTLGGVSQAFDERHNDAHAELLLPRRSGESPVMLGASALPRQRSQHTCTVLLDGAVLVAGGLTEDGDRQTTLGDVLLYTPAPLD